MFGLFGPSRKDILEEGRQAMATVRDVSDTGARVNSRPRVRLTLEVAPMGQPTFTVERKLLLSDDAFPQVGQQLPVRFLPENRNRVEIDARALEMTRAQIVTAKGTVPAAPPPPPPSPPPVPGLREQMAKTLEQYGIQMPNAPTPGAPMAASSAATPAAQHDDDPVGKLEKLSQLHKQGVLTDDEFQAAKAKVLDEL